MPWRCNGIHRVAGNICEDELDRILRVKTYPNRGAGWGGTTDGKDNRRVVILTLITDESDKTESEKLSSHLRSLLPTNNRCKVAEPLERGDSGKTVFLDGGGGASHDRLCAFGDVHESETLGALCVCLVGVERVEVVWGIVRLTTNETAEEGGDDGLGDDDLVVN